MARAKKVSPVKDEFQARINAVTKETSEDLYVELNESKDIIESVKQELNIALQGKLNEIEQAEHDASNKPLDPVKVSAPSDERVSNKPKGSLPSWVKAVSATEEQVMKYQREGKLYGHNPFKGIAYILSVFMLFFGLALPLQAADSTDETVLGNNRWSVQSDGDLVPNANTYSIGSATQYPASIWVGGAEYTSFAAGTDGNWTDNGLTTTLDQAPTKFIATHSSGDFAATGFTAGTADLTLENGQVLDGGTNGTVKITEASDSLSFIFSGSTIQVDSSDGGLQFAMSDGTEGVVDFLTNGDTDDYLSITTASHVPTIVTAGNSNLAIAPDGGTVSVTGALTASGLATSAGVTTSSTITLQNAETIANATNQTVRVSSNAASPILEVYDPGTSDSDAILKLTADAGGDAADTWQIISDGATNALLFDNAGSTVFSIPSTGIISLSAALGLSNGEQISNATDDTVRVASDDTHTGFDVYSPLTSNGTAAINLIGDAGADATDRFQIKNSADGTLTIGNDSTAAGTYIAKATIDSTGAMTVQGSEATAASIAIWADNGDDAADKFTVAIDAADSVTMTTGSTLAQTIATTGVTTLAAATVTGATTANGAVTLGDAVTDVTTMTGKIAGATPLTFDGTTADTNYTILAVGDAASSSKTVTLPSVTGTIALETASSALTPGASVTLTVVPGTDKVYTDTITTDNQDQTITFSAAGTAGDRVTIIFTSDTGGSADEVITFHNTLCRSTGTLTIANGTAESYVVEFLSNGTTWVETNRTAKQAKAS